MLLVAWKRSPLRYASLHSRRFDIEFGLSDGTTYNSYVVKGDKVAVVDVSHAKFGDAYFTALHEVVDPSSISYIVVSHTEPDHSGLVAPLLELAPHAVVVGTRVCLQFLSNLVSRPFEKLEVKAGSTLDLGASRVAHSGCASLLPGRLVAVSRPISPCLTYLQAAATCWSSCRRPTCTGRTRCSPSTRPRAPSSRATPSAPTTAPTPCSTPTWRR